MIDRNSEISLVKQCLALMRLIDEQHLKKPSYRVERLWRSVKYECVYIHVYESGSALRLGLKAWFESYNADRPHQGLNNRTPDEVYFGIKSAGCLQSNIA